MTRTRKAALATIVAALAVVLPGCFEIKEDVWIEKDGTGRIKVEIGVDRTAMGNMADTTPEKKAKEEAKRAEKKAELEKDPNVTKVEITARKEGDLDFETTEISFKDMTKAPDTLAKLKSKGSGKDEDSFTIKKLENGNYEFFQTFGHKNKPAAEGEQDPEAKKMADAMKANMVKSLGEHKITIKLHGPSIVSSNGKAEGATATWEEKLAKIMGDDSGKGMELKAEVGAK